MTRVRRPCACRGELAADPADPVDIERAVREHQMELGHASWRAREAIAGRLPAGESVALAAPSPFRLVRGVAVQAQLRKVG